MMIYSVLDNLAQRYTRPFLIETEQEAIRLFKMSINDPKNDLMYNNPEDYSLWALGTFDERTGKIDHELKKIVDGRAVKKEE